MSVAQGDRRAARRYHGIGRQHEVLKQVALQFIHRLIAKWRRSFLVIPLKVVTLPQVVTLAVGEEELQVGHIVAALAYSVKLEKALHQRNRCRNTALYVHRVIENLGHQPFGMNVNAVGHAVNDVGVGQVLLLVCLVLVLYVIHVVQAGVHRNVKLRVDTGQLHAARRHRKEGAALHCRACVNVRTVSKRLRPAVNHAYDKRAVLGGTLRGKLAVTPLGLGRQALYYGKCPLAVVGKLACAVGSGEDIERVIIFFLVCKVTRAVAGIHRHVERLIPLGRRDNLILRIFISHILAGRQLRVHLYFVPRTLGHGRKRDYGRQGY
ncbi:unknown [Prevotella sp. CAG:1124]|nr:unknown [Prevotella sp. CAG:1124]